MVAGESSDSEVVLTGVAQTQLNPIGHFRGLTSPGERVTSVPENGRAGLGLSYARLILTCTQLVWLVSTQFTLEANEVST